MQPRELMLTCKGMSSVNWNSSDSDFEFVFGEDRVYSVHSVMAEFLSPKVAHIRKGDPFCNFYTLKDSEMFNAFESLVFSLRSGEPLRIEQSQLVSILRLSQELENTELFSSLVAMLTPNTMTLEEVFLLLRAGIDLGTAFSERFGDLTDYIASHFYEMTEKLLNSLDLETAQLLLSRPSLQVNDEDSIYDFIVSRAEEDKSFTSLFEFVQFEYLSIDRMESFAAFVSTNLLENISSGMWRQICGRLIYGTKDSQNNYHNVSDDGTYKHEFLAKKLDGIIAHLTRVCSGNVHDEQIVDVTASSVWRGHPKDVADLERKLMFQSNDRKDSWICYDFKDRRVIPTSYSIRSSSLGCGSSHPKSWVLEVSNDEERENWTEIDRQEDNDELNGESRTANFKITPVPSIGFRFFRLRQIGQNHRGSNCLTIGALEIFGAIQ